MSVDIKSRRMLPMLVAWALIQFSTLVAGAGNHRLPTTENRFLIIVETSKAAGKRSGGIASTLEALITSGMQGQARPGDTIGIWTYNDNLTAGEFPLQTWSDDAGRHIAAGMMEYLETQKYTGSGRFSAVRQALVPIVKESEYITFVIICTGADRIEGTPFDAEIQKNMRNWRDQQHKAKMPIVIVLSVVRGHFSGFKITPAPWQVDMPPLPADLVEARQAVSNAVRLAEAKAVKPEPSPVPPPVSTVAPLIVSGRHHENTPTPAVPDAHLQTNLEVQSKVQAALASDPPAATPAETKPVLAKASSPAVRSSERKEPANTQAIEIKKPESSSLQTAPTAAVAVPIPRDTSVLVKRLVLVAAVLVAVVGVFLVRRTQHTHVSLITHSMDRERE